MTISSGQCHFFRVDLKIKDTEKRMIERIMPQALLTFCIKTV